MGILKDFFQSMRRPATCEGCGEDIKVCDHQCAAAAQLEAEWQQAIK